MALFIHNDNSRCFASAEKQIDQYFLIKSNQIWNKMSDVNFVSVNFTLCSKTTSSVLKMMENQACILKEKY